MPTPKKGYYLADGDRVPSVTTVISRFKDAGGLMWWAWDCGMKGQDYRDVRQQAADAGTVAHELVEAWLQKRASTSEAPVEIMDKAQKSFGAFLEWAEGSKLQVTHTEMQLVSEAHRYGGTPDALLIHGKRSMGDWKTSNAVYSDYLIQLAAYGNLWNENNPDDLVEGGFHLVRFDKQYGDFHHHYWSELDAAWRAFLHLRELYEIEKELKKRAA